MEVLAIFFTAINGHIGDILTGSFLLFLGIAIASVFVKNKHEYDAIVSDLYHDKRKSTPPAIAKKIPQNDSQYYEYDKEEEQELDEYEQYLLEGSYEVENQRDINRDVAALQDISIEREKAKQHEAMEHKLHEMQKIHKMMHDSHNKKFSKDVGQAMTSILEERTRMEAMINMQKNKAIGVNSARPHNKIKKLVAQGKIKPNKKTAAGKKIANALAKEITKEIAHEHKEKIHAQKEHKYANHLKQIQEMDFGNDAVSFAR